MPSWIDFKELRSKVSIADVLTHYGVEINAKGEQHLGFCPLPKHGGARRSPSFSVNLEENIFHCFGCQAKGNQLDLAVFMEGKNPGNGRELREIALKLRAKLCPPGGKPTATEVGEAGHSKPNDGQPELPLVLNAPLDFELQGLDAAHPYLSRRGFVKETVAKFGLGYCSRGYHAGRIAIPLHDLEGRLIGYAGRIVDDSIIDDKNPRYLLPAAREREGAHLEFKKSLFLYNGFRFTSPVESMIVVEGFPSVWWLTQNGFSRVVSTMGAECSDEQAALIVSHVTPTGRIWLIPNGDKAGGKFAESLLRQVSPYRFIRWLKLEKDKQPTDLSVKELKARLTS
jgi:DNA primase